MNNEAYFSKKFANLFDWKEIYDINNLKNSKEGRKGIEKYLIYHKNNNFPSHIYKLNDEYYISGSNKKIAELDDEEISKLSKEIKNDVEMLKTILADTLNNTICINPDKQAVFIPKDKEDFVGYVLKKMNNSSKALNILSWSNASKIDLVVQFFVEPDGTISSPVLCDFMGESSLDFVEPVFKQIRNCESWKPAIKNGTLVRSMVTFHFNLSRQRSN